MFKNLLVLAVALFVFANLVVAQDLPILWEDHFEDDDPMAWNDIGWIYYGPEDIPGQIVQQQAGELFIQAGSYGGMVGVGLVESNGVPKIEFDENGDPTPETALAILADNYNSPNVELSFVVNFKRINPGSFFIANVRMPMDSSRGDADPTEAAAYPLLMSPLDGAVMVAKYEGPMAALAPDTWNYFGQGGFAFDLEVYYHVKYYVKEGDIKVKIWEGDPEDEPDAWLIEAVDPTPRVTGTFVMLGTLGAPPAEGAGDQFILDDIVARATGETGVETSDVMAPAKLTLNQNYPNPFNPSTSISFTLPEKNMTKLVIYNTMGQVVRTLVNSEMAAGLQKLTWDGLDENLNPVTSGIYIYKLTSGEMTSSKRMLLIK
ncbi:T9SS type A sorting domain-containing protein [candidate division KSB1 bacterium]|nr:T9SS type A sorting domain-containing protein [candidate division KSB1 bacterium]